jgi:SHS2 domain-containing protein
VAYRYVDGLTRADVAFEATGQTLEVVVRSAWEATLDVMLQGHTPPAGAPRRPLRIRAPSTEELLFALLEKIVFAKDAEGILLMPASLVVREGSGAADLEAEVWAVGVDTVADRLGTDVKAVTFHHFGLVRTADGWRATVVLDV